MRLLITALTSAFALALMPVASTQAQSLEFDPVTRNYRLTFTDVDGQTHTLDVETLNRVDPRISLTVAGLEPWTFIYDVEQGTGPLALTPIIALALACAREDSGQLIASAQDGWYAHTTDRGPRRFCSVTGSSSSGHISPGSGSDSVLVVNSSRLPAIDTMYVFGRAEPVKWPYPEGVVPDSAYSLGHGVQSFEGGPLKILVPAPVRPVFSQGAEQALATVSTDVAGACGLGWVSDLSICSALAERLDSARAAVADGDNGTARSQLDAFITELHANHDTAGSLPVDDNAYALLLTNARYIRFNVLPAPSCGEVRDLPFLAGQTTDGGRVTVWNDATNVYVKYALATGWQLTESHLAVALSIDGIPTNKAGNPVVGQFPYGGTHGAGTVEYTWTVPLAEIGAQANGELLLAAHGVASGAGGSETAWAEGSRFTDQGNWAMYFTYVVTNCQ